MIIWLVGAVAIGWQACSGSEEGARMPDPVVLDSVVLVAETSSLTVLNGPQRAVARVRALVQRAAGARVRVDGQVVGEIGSGLCCLVGVTHDDDEAASAKLAGKLWNLRIFPDENGHMNLPVADAGGEMLVVSQFTLYGDTRKGRRPSFVAAAAPDEAARLIDELVAGLRRLGATVATGSFGADMAVELINDGPVTLMLEV